MRGELSPEEIVRRNARLRMLEEDGVPQGEGMRLEGSAYTRWQALCALYLAFFAKGRPRRYAVPDYAARAEIMWASTLSHNGVTGYRFIGDWASHQLEHELSGMFGVAHGAGLSAIWGAWARYVVDAAPEKFARLGRNVFGIDDSDDSSAALKTISSFENIFSSWDMPTSLGELGIKPTDEQLDELARKCSFDNSRTIGAIKKLGIEDIRKIYAAAR